MAGKSTGDCIASFLQIFSPRRFRFTNFVCQTGPILNCRHRTTRHYFFQNCLKIRKFTAQNVFWKRNIVYFAPELLYVIAVLRKFVSASLFGRFFRLLPICLRLMSPWYHGTVSAWVYTCHCHVLLLFESFSCATTRSSYYYTQQLSAVALCL